MPESVIPDCAEGIPVKQHCASPNRRRILLLLATIGALTACFVHPGSLGSIDASRRLQVTRSFWTDAPPVSEADQTSGTFGIYGTNGRIHAWYGIGQSVAMLPADVLAVSIVNSVPALGAINRRQAGAVERALVALQISAVVAGLTMIVAYSFLSCLGFSAGASASGSLALLFGTTFLNYTQNAQENSLLLLLTLTGFWLQYRWVHGRRTLDLVMGSAAMGLNILVRLTAVLDIAAVSLFIVLALWHKTSSSELRGRLVRYGILCGTVYALFIGLDRWYHFERFGSLNTTYISIFGEQWKTRFPGIPSSFPFSTPFMTGFKGALFSADKSVFLYDPLTVLTLFLCVIRARNLRFHCAALVAATLLMLIAYVCFYARYFDWSGDHAWGDRFTSTPVQILALLSVPLLFDHIGAIRNALTRLFAFSLLGFSIALQLSSVLFSYNLEIIQATTGIRHSPVFLQRWVNAFAALSGQFEEWKLGVGVPLVESRLYLMPFGAASELIPSIQKGILTAWLACGVLLLVCILALRREFRIHSKVPSSQKEGE